MMIALWMVLQSLLAQATVGLSGDETMLQSWLDVFRTFGWPGIAVVLAWRAGKWVKPHIEQLIAGHLSMLKTVSDESVKQSATLVTMTVFLKQISARHVRTHEAGSEMAGAFEALAEQDVDRMKKHTQRVRDTLDAKHELEELQQTWDTTKREGESQ